MTRRRGHSRANKTYSTSAKDSETVRLVNAILDNQTVDILQLRKLVVVRGLVNNRLRSRVWPLLLGLASPPPKQQDQYWEIATSGHRDSTVVDCDVARSLWSLTRGWTDASRGEQRNALHRLLSAVVGGSNGTIRYYQGMHDVAAVLLFTVGELEAYPILEHLARQQLRDATRPGLEPVVELLHLLFPIVRKCDPELHCHIQVNSIPPFFALSWYITWFAHNVDSQQQIARLFDLFLASHPLMPLYVAAVAMRANRKQLLCCDDPSELHHALSTMPILGPGQPSADEIAQQAAALYQAAPPVSLTRACPVKLVQCVAVSAYKEQGRWRVPDTPRAGAGRYASTTVAQLHRIFRPQQRSPKAAKLVAMMITATGLAALGAAVLVAHIQQQHSLFPV